jgi:predicted transcriptional regulator
MTCKELISYILTNDLENEPVFKDGKFIGFITAGEAAEKFNVGVATICVWVVQKRLDGIFFNDILYVAANCELKPEVSNAS